MKKKLLLVISLILTIGVAVVVVFIGLKANDTSESSGSLLPSVGQEHGIKLATTTEGDGSILVTASYGPSDAYLNNLTWSVEFVEKSLLIEEHSSWLQAIGSTKKVTDFISLTPNGTSCSVKCNEAFGCPIILKCQSTSNPNVSATCQLDYIKRIVSLNRTDFIVQLSAEDSIKIGNSSPTNFEIDFSEFNDRAYPVLTDKISIVRSAGTMDDDFSFSYEVVLDNQLFTFLNNEFGSFEGHPTNSTYTFNNVTYDSKPKLSLSFDMFEKFGWPSFNSGELNDRIFPYIMDNCGGHIFDITFSYNGQHSTLTETFHFNVSAYNFNSTIEDITLDQSHIVF